MYLIQEIMETRSGGHMRQLYYDALWEIMDWAGVNESIERKVVAAVTLQFLAAVGQVVLPFFVSGVVWYVLAGGLFAAAAVAFVNTLLIVRRDFVAPIQRLEEQASDIAAGTIDITVERADQPDEIGSLTAAFADMAAYFDTVSEQAVVLARQEFDAEILDREVPGEFGESLDRMARNLEEHTQELEEMADRMERRSQRLERLVTEFGEATEQAREGDLTATIDDAGDDDLTQQVAENYNALVGSLADAVSDVKAFADRVAEASDEVDASMSGVEETGDEVARSVQTISEGATKQTESIQTVTSDMNTLSATVQEIAASADEAAVTAQTAADRGRSGREAAADAIDELDDLERRITKTAAAVEGLADRIAEIDEVVSFIDEIAEETNMLALNASIEAARAGEAGEGFAVVASEIKGLAEETRQSADEISTQISRIQTDSRETASDVHTMEGQVTESTETIESTLSDFEEVVGVVEELNASIQEINQATDDQAETADEVVGQVEDVTAISNRTSSEAEDVATAAEEQTATISEVTADVQALASGAADLQSRLSSFEVERGDVSPREGPNSGPVPQPKD